MVINKLGLSGLTQRTCTLILLFTVQLQSLLNDLWFHFSRPRLHEAIVAWMSQMSTVTAGEYWMKGIKIIGLAQSASIYKKVGQGSLNYVCRAQNYSDLNNVSI